MRVRPATQAVYDQIVAALEDAGGLPLSTDELIEKVSILERRDAVPDRFWDRWETVVEAPPAGCFLIRRKAHQSDVYPRVKQLEARGVLRCVRVDGMRCVYWQLTAVTVPDDPRSLVP